MKSVLNEVPEVFVQHGRSSSTDAIPSPDTGMVSPVPGGCSSHVSVALSEDVPDVLWSSLPAPEGFRCPQLVLYLCAQSPLVSDLRPFQAMYRNGISRS